MASEVNSDSENCETCYGNSGYCPDCHPEILDVCPHSGLANCSDCGGDIKTPKIQRSHAGYYIGTFCHCGPYARWSVEYYGSFQMATDALDNNSYTLRPNP